MRNPKVSIIVTNFNGEHIIEKCLSSIIKNSYKNYEIIVIDDCSSDKSVRKIKKFRNVRLIENKKNIGPSACRNIGVLHARGELLAFIDNDVFVDINWLSHLVSCIVSDKNTGACTSKILFADGKINSAGGGANIFGEGFDRGINKNNEGYDEQRNVFFGCSASLMTWKSIFEDSGGFDDDYFYLYEDLDYCWRLRLLGYKIIYEPKSVVYHNFHGTMNISEADRKYFSDKNRLLSVMKNYKNGTLAIMLPLFFAFESLNLFAPALSHKDAHFILSGIDAWRWNVVHARTTLKKRRFVNSIRKVNDMNILSMMKFRR